MCMYMCIYDCITILFIKNIDKLSFLLFNELYSSNQVLLVVKNPPANAEDKRDTGSIPGLGRSPGGGMAIHSSILAWRIPMDRGAWRAIVYRVAKSQTWLKRLSMQAFFWSTWNLRADSQGLKYVLCELDRGLCKKSIILLTPLGEWWAFVSSGIWPRRSAKFFLTFYDSFAK